MLLPNPPRRIIFFNRFYWPDQSATALLLTDLAEHLATNGHEVHVICSRKAVKGAPLMASESRADVHIHRVAGRNLARFGLMGRALEYLAFYPPAIWQGWRLARPGDLLIAKTDPPLLSVPVAMVAHLRGSRFMAWMQDIYPEVAAKLGVGFAGGMIGRLLTHLRNRSLRRAERVVVIGERMAQFVRVQGVAPTRITVVHNWPLGDLALPAKTNIDGLKAEWGFAPTDFIIGYSGNLGRAHDVATILGAARQLQQAGESNVHFLFVGHGPGHAELQERIAVDGLTQFHFLPHQPLDRLRTSLAVPDVHWISLRPELEGLIVPSKFYGVAASARPILFVGDKAGEIATIIEQSGCGVAIASGDSNGLAKAILEFRDGSSSNSAGDAARILTDNRYSRVHALAQWDQLLSSSALVGAGTDGVIDMDRKM